ncbi:hypothetical protein ES703_52874 [subsurface metagenome]
MTYARDAANLHYRNFSIYGQKQEIHKAIEVAEHALALLDAQEVSGPRHWVNLRNRISLYAFLANCYIEQVLEPCEVRTKSQTQEWMADAEQAVREIEQLFGSGEDPQVVKWQAMLELAKGNRNKAIKKLYAAYEQLKAASVRPELERVVFPPSRRKQSSSPSIHLSLPAQKLPAQHPLFPAPPGPQKLWACSLSFAFSL